MTSRASDDYKHLLRYGGCSSADEVHVDQLSPEERERWEEQVAEPWYRTIREQAEHDGLRVETYLGYGWHPVHPERPAARLLRPDGSEIPMEHGKGGAFRSDRYERAMLADWGETLANARTRMGVATPRWRVSRGPDEPMRSWLAALLRRRR
jgi:hypothetical protein